MPKNQYNIDDQYFFTDLTNQPIKLETIQVEIEIFSPTLSNMPGSNDHSSAEPFHCVIANTTNDISLIIPGKRGYDYFDSALHRLAQKHDLNNQDLNQKTKTVPITTTGYFKNFSKQTCREFKLKDKIFILSQWTFLDSFTKKQHTEGQKPDLQKI